MNNGILTVSDTLDTKYSKQSFNYDAVSAAIEIMEGAEKYPEIKSVIIDIGTNNPYIPKILHIETRTGSGINWKSEIPINDIKEYSKTVFDKVTWF